MEVQRRSKEATARRTLNGLREMQKARIFRDEEWDLGEPEKKEDRPKGRPASRGTQSKGQEGSSEDDDEEDLSTLAAEKHAKASKRTSAPTQPASTANGKGSAAKFEAHQPRKASVYFARRPSNMLKVIDEYEDSPSKRPTVEQFLRKAGTLRLASGSRLQRTEGSKHKVSNERLREAASHG